jgi:tRNA (mo5U34)-methyltransferase
MSAAAAPQADPGITWFHSHAFPDGGRTAGIKPAEVLAKEADAIFHYGVAGKSVLDIGAWDGYFSFEAEKRGASRVLATDHFCWSGPGWGTKAGFDHAHARYQSKVESLDIDVPQISPATVGVFDVVLFLGVLYHVKDPFASLEQVASVTGEMMVVETESAFDPFPWPLMRFYEGTSLNNDPTNFWAPNKACLEAMFRELGFKRTEIKRHPCVRPSWRHPDLYWKRNRVILHAWR